MKQFIQYDRSPPKKAQTTFEYALLLMVVLSVGILVGRFYLSGVRDFGVRAKLTEKWRRSYTNGHFLAYGLREKEEGIGASGDELRTHWIHPLVQQSSSYRNFFRRNSIDE